LFLEGQVSLVVVVCPNTVKGAWADPERGEIAKYTPDAVRFGVVRCDSDKYTQWGKDLDHLRQGDKLLVWIVVNYEALRSPAIRAKIEAAMRARATLMVLDEATRVKSPQAQQTQAAVTLGKLATRRVIMSGTPIASRPLDLYAQFAFLDKAILGQPTFAAFRARYAQLGGYAINGRPVEIVGYQHLDELERNTAGFSRRVLKRDCLDLPPKVYETRQVALSPDQWDLYRAMRDELYVELEGGGTVSAPIVLTKLLRLTQITSGFVAPDADPVDGRVGEARYIPGAAKVDAFLELLDDLPPGEKVIAWCRFHAEMALLRERLADRKVGCVEVHGRVTGADRDEAIRRFQEDPAIQVLIGQQQTGGIGITLTAASVVVYLTNSYSWEVRAQSEDRAHRHGQTKSVTYIDLLATGPSGGMTVDHAVLEAVTQKRDLAALVLGDFKKILKGD
jgi:SNF2 family DNA or RNA helicase